MTKTGIAMTSLPKYQRARDIVILKGGNRESHEEIYEEYKKLDPEGRHTIFGDPKAIESTKKVAMVVIEVKGEKKPVKKAVKKPKKK